MVPRRRRQTADAENGEEADCCPPVRKQISQCPPAGEALKSVLVGAEHFAHHADQLQGPVIADAIKDPVGIFARGEDTLIAQDRKMLRDIALRGTNLIDYAVGGTSL